MLRECCDKDDMLQSSAICVSNAFPDKLVRVEIKEFRTAHIKKEINTLKENFQGMTQIISNL